MTLRYLYGQDALVGRFVAGMIPHWRGHDLRKCRAIGVVNRDNELIAGMVYHEVIEPEPGWRYLEMSMAAVPGQRWLTPETLAVAYRYPFLDLGCGMVLHRFPADNDALQRQGAAFGCSLSRIPQLFGRERDGIVAALTYEDWVNNKICRRYRHYVAVTKRKAA